MREGGWGNQRTGYFSRGLSPFKGWSHHEPVVPAGINTGDHVDNEAACVVLNHLEPMRRAVAWLPSAINCHVLLDTVSMALPRRGGGGNGQSGVLGEAHSIVTAKL